MKFSVVIPYSQDYPCIWFTVQDKYLRLMENYSHDEYEVIIVNNGSTGDNLSLARRMCGRDENNPNTFTDHLSKEPSTMRRNLKYVEIEKQLSPKTAINIGAWKAKGKYLMVCDAHVLVNSDYFTQAEQFMDGNDACTVLHSSISWNVRDAAVRAYQYKLGVNENGIGIGHLLGTWSTTKHSDKPYRISSSGTCSYVLRAKNFKEKYGGYPSMLRGYGGGEPYIDLLAWMMGDEVYLHPDMYSAHFALTRSRGYEQGGPIVMARNYILAWYILGGLKWANLIRDDVIDRHREQHPDWAPRFYEAFNEAIRWGRFRRKHVEEKAVYTLDELLRKFKDDNIP